MGFNPGDIVEILRPDLVTEDERPVYDMWSGFTAKVSAPPVMDLQEFLRDLTRLEPVGDRPDSHEPGIDPHAWFYWHTNELRLVERTED